MAILCLYSFSVEAQEVELHKIYFHPNQQIKGNFEEVKENNLPIKNTRVFYQSSDQTVWVGTFDDGLIAYSGTAVKHYRFDPKNKNSLPNNRVSEIWEESPSILWITTDDGIVKFNRLANRFTRFPPKSRYVRRGQNRVLYTSVMTQGLFTIDTANVRLQRVKSQDIIGGKGALYPNEVMMYIRKLEVDKEGTLWALGETKNLGGLFHFNIITGQWVMHIPDAFYARSDTDGLLIYKKTNPQKMSIYSLFIDDNDRIWFGGWGEGLLCYNKKDGQWKQFSFYRNSSQTHGSENCILGIYSLNKNELWITSWSNGFVFNFYEKKAYHYTSLDGNGTPTIFKSEPEQSLVDHCGNQWIGGSIGVFKYNPLQTHFTASARLKSSLFTKSILTAFYQISPEHYLAGTSGADQTQLDFHTDIYEVKNDNIIRHFSLNRVDESAFLKLFIPGGSDEFYVCGYNLHKLNLKKGSLETIRVNVKNEIFRNGVYADYYNTILWNDSTLYTCRRADDLAGLVKVHLLTREAQLYKTTSLQLSPRLPQDNTILRLLRDSYNRIWCSAAGGLDIFYPDKDTFDHYYPVEGDTASLIGQQPRFCETSDHTFYIASRAGVCATKALPGTRATFTPIVYLDCDWIVADRANMLWVGTTKGVARINPKNQTYKIFDNKDGYYWSVSNKPLVMPDGRFLMSDGVIIDPAALTQNTFKPVPGVSDFLVAGQPFPLDTAIEFKKHIQLKNHQNFFSISYTCNNYINEEDNTYRYHLEGVDKNWIEAGNRTVAYYTSISPGTYHFYVQAANNNGIWGEPKKLLTLTIVPAWYQTWWFKTGIALLIIAIVSAFYRQQLLKERAKHLAAKREAELKQREAEVKQIKTEFEKQIAETEMAALRSQMNPHFIFNVLNSINKYILSNDKDAASAYLVEFSRLIRLTLENSKAAKVPLQSDLEALRIYIEMEKLRFGNKFTCSIELEENIDPQYLHIPPMLIQPYVENAIWHGLMQKDTPGFLQVQATQPDENLVKVVVQDNGIGRAMAQEIKSKSATAHKSYGLQITNDRIKIVNKLYGIKATVTVDDLYDDAEQAAGTKVTLMIPV